MAKESTVDRSTFKRLANCYLFRQSNMSLRSTFLIAALGIYQNEKQCLKSKMILVERI